MRECSKSKGFGFYNGELVTGAAQQAMRDIAATNAIAISIVPPIQRADLALFGANDFAFV